MNIIVKRAFLSGCFIGIGGIANLVVGGNVGAAAFAFGLLFIFLLKCPLCTGLIGFAKKWKDIFFILKILVLNFFGACVIGLAANVYSELVAKSSLLVAKKLGTPLITTFVNATFCGVLVLCATLAFKLKGFENSFLTVVFCVFVFIACGFEHCVADAFYIASCSSVSFNFWSSVKFLSVVALGNAVGAITTWKLIRVK